MDHESWHWALHEIVDDLVVHVRPQRLDAAAVRFVRECADHGEYGIATEDLAACLLRRRVPLSASEADRVRSLLVLLPTEGARPSPYAVHAKVITTCLQQDVPVLRRRGVPPLRGGHVPGAERVGASRFPPSWSPERVDAAADRIVTTGDPTVLANGRTWLTGVVDEVRMGVLTAPGGSRRTVAPLDGPGVLSGPRSTEYGRVPTFPDVLAGCVAVSARNVLMNIGIGVPSSSAAVLRDLVTAGECEEFADLLAALGDGVPEQAREEAAILLRSFDLPVEGCAYLNDRDAVLGRWAA